MSDNEYPNREWLVRDAGDAMTDDNWKQVVYFDDDEEKGLIFNIQKGWFSKKTTMNLYGFSRQPHSPENGQYRIDKKGAKNFLPENSKENNFLFIDDKSEKQIVSKAAKAKRLLLRFRNDTWEVDMTGFGACYEAAKKAL